jgi:hypothetical protein
MSKLGIITGTNPNDGTGDTLLSGAYKINSNFDEIYASIGNGTNLTNTIGYAVTSGSSTYSSFAGIATNAGYATTSGISTASRSLTGSPDITVNSISSSGIVTASGFITTSDLAGRSVEIKVIGSILTFNVVGLGSTNLTLY